MSYFIIPPVDPADEYKDILPDDYSAEVYARIFTRKEIPIPMLHSHPMIQYTLVLEGEMTYSVWKKEFVVPVGSGLFVNYNRLHSIAIPEDRPMKLISILIDPLFIGGGKDSFNYKNYVLPFLASSAPDAALLLPDSSYGKRCLSLIQEIYTYCSRADYGYQLTVSSLNTELWLNTIHAIQQIYETEPPALPSQDKLRADQIISFIHINYSQKLSLDDLADCAGISRGECCRLFKRAVKASPIDFLNQYRIRQSQVMLCDTQHSILQIAGDCGFPSINHFVTLFKRYTGMTPREYRKERSSNSARDS